VNSGKLKISLFTFSFSLNQMAVERSQKEVWRLAPYLMVVLLLGNFILMAFDAKEENSKQRILRVWTQAAADFVQSPVTTVASAANNYFQSIATLRNAQTDNDVLKERLQALEIELQSGKTLSAENERLKSLIQLKDETKFKILMAKVVGRDPSTWFDSSIVNRGNLDGIKVNMPVVTNEGLAGRVIAVSPITSQFVLISDDKSAAAAIVGQLGASNALGVVRGMNDKDQLEMRYVPGSIPVAVGEIVYTTGLDGIYPPGLKIGEVIEVRPGSTTIPHTIYVRPSAKISSMQEVAILLYQQTERPKYEQALPNTITDANMLVNSNTAVNPNANANTNR
jgi:rod shape-determining protein MreC